MFLFRVKCCSLGNWEKEEWRSEFASCWHHRRSRDLIVCYTYAPMQRRSCRTSVRATRWRRKI